MVGRELQHVGPVSGGKVAHEAVAVRVDDLHLVVGQGGNEQQLPVRRKSDVVRPHAVHLQAPEHVPGGNVEGGDVAQIPA